MKEFWDQRFSSNEYVYGNEPNQFFKSELDKLLPGKLLLPGDGEGRNAVYAAIKGWDVYAFDYSTEAHVKAKKLASDHQVNINYINASISDIPFANEKFDVIALIFLHLSGEERSKYHKEIQKQLIAGGLVILQAFTPAQVLNERISGGPKDLGMLYSRQMLANDFINMNILYLQEETNELNEGIFHQGTAEVIKLLAQPKIFQP